MTDLGSTPLDRFDASDDTRLVLRILESEMAAPEASRTCRASFRRATAADSRMLIADATASASEHLSA